jgi:CRISPR-associated protein Cas1
LRETDAGRHHAPSADKEAALRTRPAPVMRVLYVVIAGGLLSVRGAAFAVFRGEAEVAVIPAAEVDRIEIGPLCKVTAAAIRLALARNIPIAFVDGWGRTRGTCERPPPDKAALHLEQARCLLDPSRRLDLARSIVSGRIRNQRALLRRLNRKRHDARVEGAVRFLKVILRRLPAAAHCAELMGLEGAATAIYWKAWGGMLAAGWRFERRIRRPPRDPINVVLSYLAAMLHRDVAALALRHGLHPGFGALHAARDGHEGCVSDLVEEFRAPLVEGFALYLVNNEVLASEMFFMEEGRCSLVALGVQRLIRAYERWLDRPVVSPRSGRRILWRRLIEEQVVAYARHCRGEQRYQAYEMDL